MRCKIIIILVLAIFTSQRADCQSFSEKKTFQNTFRVSRESSLELDNKYGTVHISTWDRDSVSLRAEVDASASGLDRLHKLFQGVDINISGAGSVVRAYPEFTQSVNMLFESFKGMTNKFIPYESKLQINWFVNVPVWLDIKVTNRYGDLWMEDCQGRLSISISNGSLRAGNISNGDNMELVFCDATINSITKGDVNASFSEIKIDNSGSLTIEGVSSKFSIEKADELITESRRDKFYIGSVNVLRGNSYFTDFDIGKVETEINLEVKYGSLETDQISKNVELVSINSGYTDINIEFEEGASYNADIRHTNTFLVLPGDSRSFEKRVINEEKKEYVTYGQVGRNPGNKKLIINATRGNIYIKQP